jgi:hypothetical protein
MLRAGPDARVLYLDLMERCLLNTIYADPPSGPWKVLSQAHTMIGQRRMANLRQIVERVPGDLIETGVWHGGAWIYISSHPACCGQKTYETCRSGPPVFVVPTKPNAEGGPMRYMMLICNDEVAWEQRSEEVAAASMAEYGQFMEEMGARNVLQGGERLRPTGDATTVRVRDGKLTTVDGPFAETKEQIGGYFVVDCKDLDEAIEIASKVPGARDGSIEVRPIWEM